jgi:ribose/xylose/arabinose/galactoside ABC-type transport system permease subunit
MNTEKTLWGRIAGSREALTKYLTLASTVAILIVFTAITPSFLGPRNIINILKDLSPVLVMACGEGYVLMLGSIDLSIGSVASCAAVMLTVLLKSIGPWAYPVVILYGVLAGVLNGVLHTRLSVPSFIATLSTSAIWQSFAYLLSGGQPLTMLPDVWPYVNWAKFTLFGAVPILFIVALLVLVSYSLVSRFTSSGHTVRAAGANERATWLMGRNVRRAKVAAFLYSGLGAALGGILFAVKLKSGIPTVGVQYTMLAIAAAVLGGLQMTGGKGSILMTLLGALLITVIQNGMNVVGVSGLLQQIIFGTLLLIAIYINSDKQHKGLVVK